ncbi:MAG: hypothetical protein V3574_04035 [Candidatus Moraniibacteriota bacterium]
MKKGRNLKEIFKKENFDLVKIRENFCAGLLRNAILVFMFFLLVTAVLSLMIIYKYVYSSVWSEEEKANYLKEVSRGGVSFDEKNFYKVVGKIKDRRMNYEKKDFLQTRDIFTDKMER